MGYTTDFYGKFTLDRPLEKSHAAYLAAFADTRRMKRSATLTKTLDDPKREAVGLPVGVDGGYFVQDDCPGIADPNEPPDGQPGLWCQWVPTEDGTGIVHDGGEKFYQYTEWLAYLVEHFLKPWGYVLNGEVEWQGEQAGDSGTVYVTDNVVEAVNDEIVKPKPKSRRVS